MNEFTDFSVIINGEHIIHNDFIITDGKSQMTLQKIEDLPKLLRKRWLMLIAPVTNFDKNGMKIPTTNGIDLIFRKDIKVTPIYDEEVYG